MIGSVTDDSQPGDRFGQRYVAGRLEPVQVDREDQHEVQGDQEARDREAEHRDDLDGAVDRTAAAGGETPRMTETIAVTIVVPMTSERVTARRPWRLTDDELAVEPGAAEVAGEGVREPVPVLHDDRAVETELLRLLRDDLRRWRSDRRCCRAMLALSR